MKWLAWLGCTCMALVTVGACSGDEGKKTERGEDGGAAGEVASAPGGGGQEPSGGRPTSSGGEGGVAEIPVDGGAAGAAEAGAGGEGGVASDGLSLASLQGKWTGHLLGSYECESSVEDVELVIEGSAVTSAWGIQNTAGSGEIEQQAGPAFTFGLFVDNGSFEQNYRAQFFVHPSGTYALAVLRAYYEEGPSNEIVVGILQKAEASDTPPDNDALAGQWNGTGVELDSSFEVVSQFESNATFNPSEGLVMSGEDRDGAFEGIVLGKEAGASTAEFTQQGANEIGVILLMSDDSKVLAVAMLRDLSENNGALCNLDDPYSDMSVHKFALWDKYFD